ncbi:alanine racemase [candidate division KSB3 bacterium]|uniref:Alanine racemase n=1 Tax=candidate division KSB3 bacterium TaxID=2044937 RepID=A0A2G6KC27_9BACT|nr:MAG: alanine racemase [candidate division KSB3 bacterium]
MNIIKPTFLLNKDRVLRNIKRMADKAKRSGVRFRPHFKTHQSALIGEWFRAVGVDAITVSSVSMAEYFAEHGWQDMTIAFPINVREIDAINRLAERVTLHLLVESEESVHFLRQHLSNHVNVWIKIDTGYHRTGLAWDNCQGIVEVVRAVFQADPLVLRGLLTHAGQTYSARSSTRVREVHQETVSRMQAVRDTVQTQEEQVSLEISIGDTPGCSVVEQFDGVDEIRPGNFVFYDVTQLTIGSCLEEDVAVAVACPVVAKHEERLELVVYGGAVHLSKESVSVPSREKPIYGYLALPEAHGWGTKIPETFVVGLSQEHGIIHTQQSFFEKIRIGDIVVILPVHSCLTANLLRKYHTITGEVIELADLT